MKQIIKDADFLLIAAIAILIPFLLWLLSLLSLPFIPAIITLTGLAARQIVKISVNSLAIKKNPELLQQQAKEETHFQFIRGLY